MKNITILALVFAFSCARGVLIDSALINLSGSSIALWGDLHAPGSDTDKMQLNAIKHALCSRPNDRQIHFILEEASAQTKIQNFLNKHILSNARDVQQKHPYYKPVSTENIEMRGVALASTFILGQPKIKKDNWNYLNDSYEDAHNSYLLRNINIGTLRKAFNTLLKKCTFITRNKKDRFGQPLWHDTLNDAVRHFKKAETIIAAYTGKLVPHKNYKNKKKQRLHQRQIRNAVTIYQLKNKIDQEQLSIHIIDAFSALFDIILAHRILSLVNNGYDVAVAAGAAHTRNIQAMILKTNAQARVLFERHQSTPLTSQDINVFERVKPWWQRNRAYNWCTFWIPDITLDYM